MPAAEIAKQQAIMSISAGRLVTCSPEHYQEAVRSAIVNQGQQWLEAKNVDGAKRVLGEIARLDKVFGVGK